MWVGICVCVCVCLCVALCECRSRPVTASTPFTAFQPVRPSSNDNHIHIVIPYTPNSQPLTFNPQTLKHKPQTFRALQPVCVSSKQARGVSEKERQREQEKGYAGENLCVCVFVCVCVEERVLSEYNPTSVTAFQPVYAS